MESDMTRIPNEEFTEILDALKSLVLSDGAPETSAARRKALASAERILERYGEMP